MSLTQVLDQKPEDVLLPNKKLNDDILKNLKSALDVVAPKYSPLDAVHVDGLKADQVWVQVQMVLDGVSEKLSSTISQFTPEAGSMGANDDVLELSDQNDEKDEDLSGEELDDDSFDEKDESQIPDEDIVDDDSEEEPVDFENLKDDYVDEDMSQDDIETSNSRSTDGDQPSGQNTEDSDREEQFDLGEFQQHVLRLEQDGSEDDGPEIDYNAELGESSDEEGDEDIRYQDFFGTAPKMPRTEFKPKKKVQFTEDDNGPWSDEEAAFAGKDTTAFGDLSNSEKEAMQSARKDLFDDDDDDENEKLSKGDQLSKFEKQQQELSQQIAELEAENMGQKDWGMRGEAKAKDRPEDSLFSIQFDRSSKPAPAITEEATTSLEEMIKSRIRKQQFDDIPRRSELSAPGDLKRELPELSEQKSGKSLSELYEEDRMRAENPEYFAKQDSAVMDAAHQDIASLYSSVARRLDALCSWAYTPKAAAPSLHVVTQGSSIAMEEAQPGTMAPETQLAPQEIYKSQSAVPMDNSEMTTSMKRKRRREKSLQKSGAPLTSSSSRDGKRTKRDKKESMISTLKQGNVTMVDKRGDKRDMRGNKVKEGVSQTASHMKL